MIFEAEHVVWKLKKGVNIPYGPDQSVNESNIMKTQSDFIIESGSSANHQHQRVAQEQIFNDSMVTELSPIKASDNSNAAVQESDSLCSKSEIQTESRVEKLSNGDKGKANNESVQPSSTNRSVIVDGVAVDPVIVSNTSASLPKWASLPYRLRKHRADVFVKATSAVPFAQSLFNYLRTKGLDVKDYDESVNYLPTDILLLDNTDLVRQGTVIVLQEGKRAVWDKLLSEFGDRLK